MTEGSQDKSITIAKGLTEGEEAQLIACLKDNQDVFTLSKKDLKGISRGIIEHRLNLDPKVPPRRQKLRVISTEMEKAAQREVQKLLDVGVIREVQFTTWLSNIVIVPKKNGDQRMCIDFTSTSPG